MPYNSQILPVHAAMLHTGKLLYFSGSGNDPAKFPDRRMETRLWDPVSGAIERVAPHATQQDLFCTGQCFLPDGNLLVAGGNTGYPVSRWLPLFTGLPDTFLFDPAAAKWSRSADMRDGRWYPTCLPLPDGRVAAFSGLMRNPWKLLIPPFSLLNKRVEVWNSDGASHASGRDFAPGHWEDLHAGRRMEYYPRVHLLPSGELVRVAPERDTLGFDVSAPRWRRIGRTQSKARYQGTSVLLPLRPPGYEPRILLLGGSPGDHFSTAATNTVEVFGQEEGRWGWRWAPSMTFPRRHVNATLLLDGRVLVTGGGRKGNEEPIFEAELFDPISRAWRVGATCHVARLYHSVAVLLPDGRVWTGGGNPGWGDDELRIEVYTPGYWDDPDRPEIEDLPTRLAFGTDVHVRVKSTSRIVETALVRPSAVTHSFNVEQRWVGLEFAAAGTGRLRVTAPPGPTSAPPGWYLLTAIDEERRPSRARWVLLQGGA